MEKTSLIRNRNKNYGPFPIEILLSIFSYLDGRSLITCKQVCRQWDNLIACYDDSIWPTACHLDFEAKSIMNQRLRRFWYLKFPSPTTILLPTKPKWQDLYKITHNWYNGFTKGYYPTIASATTKSSPSMVIGAPQEEGMFTTLTLSHDNRVIRSNPNYTQNQLQNNVLKSLLIQHPSTNQSSFLQVVNNSSVLDEFTAIHSHSVVCHYTLPSSHYLVTGALNGTVAIWNLKTKSLVRMWQGHRGRVLCITMNDEVVVSGGSDNMIRVWDLDKNNSSNTNNSEWTNHHRPARRGMIDISSYLSGPSEWYQGVGEIAVNGHLIACAPDASGPILVFSLLTGSLVYELRTNPNNNEWVTEDITAFTRLCLTPFFLLTKGKVSNKDSTYPILPLHQNAVIQRNELAKKPAATMGYVTKLSDNNNHSVPAAQMTPYQLYRYYQSIQNDQQQQQQQSQQVPQSSACINVWDLQSGKILYRLLPTLENPYQNYTINDIRLSPDYSKVFASIEIRGSNQYQERIYCWDFSIFSLSLEETQNYDFIELEQSNHNIRTSGKSWVCYM